MSDRTERDRELEVLAGVLSVDKKSSRTEQLIVESQWERMGRRKDTKSPRTDPKLRFGAVATTE
jgi:hypothetical protein